MPPSKGLKLDRSVLDKALKAVENGQHQMLAISGKLSGQGDDATVAMKASAGQIMSGNYTDMSAGGRALQETLAQLHTDLVSMGAHGDEGNNQATSHANRAASLVSTSVSSGMA
ncbi:MAG: hypothetical protein ACR2F6_04790 [Mycobacteriales bacterium]